MPRVYNWSRGADGGEDSSGARATLKLGDFPAGSTLEKVIFGFHLLQNVFYGGTTAVARYGALAIGVVPRAVSLGAPAFDPQSAPTADWLWCGVFQMEAVQIRSTCAEEYRVEFKSPPQQLETTTRRHNSLGEAQRVWLTTQPLGALDSGFPLWAVNSFGSVLYSELTP